MANNHDRYSVPVYSDKVKQFTIQENKPTSLRKRLRQHFQDFSSSTSIHGFAYFGENRTCIEYIFWAVVFILSICAAVYMIYGVYEKWYYSPVLVSFATRNTPIFDIPFPAVTICPTTVFDRSKFNKEEYKKKISSGQSGTDEEKFIALFLDKYCDTNNTFSGTFISESQDEPFSEKFYEYFLNNAAKRSYIIYYRDEEYKFEDFFKPTITQEGLCYTFNRLRMDEIFRDTVVLDNRDNDFEHSNWDQEIGYSTEIGIDAYPYRALFSGIHNALQIVIIEDKKSVGAYCRTLLQGYVIILMQLRFSLKFGIKEELNYTKRTSLRHNLITTSVITIILISGLLIITWKLNHKWVKWPDPLRVTKKEELTDQEVMVTLQPMCAAFIRDLAEC